MENPKYGIEGAGITKSGSAVADDCEQAESLLDDGEQSVSVDEFRAATLAGISFKGYPAPDAGLLPAEPSWNIEDFPDLHGV